MATKNEILATIQASVLTTQECHEIFDALNNKMRQIHTAAAASAIMSLAPGMSVSFGDKSRRGKGGYKEGVITEIRKTKVVVDVDGLLWTVPAEHAKVLDRKPKTAPPTKCPTCLGSGKQNVSITGVTGKESMEIDCVVCKGKGVATAGQLRLLEAEKNMWCKCEKPSDTATFHDDGECRQCKKHHYHCENCGKITQVG